MCDEDVKIERLAWDSEFFGFPVGRLAVTSDRLQPCGLRSKIDASGCRLIYVFLPVGECHDLRRVVADLGGQLRDVKVTYRKKVGRMALSVDGRCEATVVTDELEMLAYASGWCSRFATDDRLSPFFHSMYSIWLKRDFERGKVFVRQESGRIEGMVTTSIFGSVGKIGLLAVDSSCCGRGIGLQLMRDADSWFAEAGVTECEVVTQHANVAACGLYEKVGYSTFSQYEVWHLWTDGIREGGNR